MMSVHGNKAFWQGRGNDQSRGFTLIELIVVIGIIAILFAIMMPAIAGLRERARQREADVTKRSLEVAIRAFRTEYGKWPGPNPDANCVYSNAAQTQIMQDLLSTSAQNLNKTTFWETPGIITNYATKQPFSIEINVDSNTVTVL